LAAQGTAIVLISSEMPELLALADRILVMRQGRISGELDPKDATEEKVLQYAAGTVGR
jgi:ribose transport system ATP-binding protein